MAQVDTRSCAVYGRQDSSTPRGGIERSVSLHVVLRDSTSSARPALAANIVGEDDIIQALP